MQNIKVSIIVPVYNAEKYIDRCIESLLSQTYDNIEIVLVDDGSTDKSYAICNYYTSKNAHILLEHKLNGGASSTRNRGIELATGNYIMFVDADDWIETDAVENMIDSILRNNVEACFTSKYYKDDELQSSTSCVSGIYNASELLEMQANFDFIASQCFGMIESKAVKKNKFNEQVFAFEDWDFNYRVLKSINTACVIDKAFYHYMTNNGSSSMSPLDEKKMSCFKIIDKLNTGNNEIVNTMTIVIKANLMYHMLVIYAQYGAVSIDIKRKLQVTVKELYSKRGMLDGSRRLQRYIMVANISVDFFGFIYRLKNGRKDMLK